LVTTIKRPTLLAQTNESGVAAFDATISPGGDDDVVAESAISVRAFLFDFQSIRQKRQSDLALLRISGEVAGNVPFDSSFADSVCRVWKIAGIVG